MLEGALPFFLRWRYWSSGAGDVQGHDDDKSKDRPLVNAHLVPGPVSDSLYAVDRILSRQPHELPASCLCSLSTCVLGSGLNSLRATLLNIL